MLLNYHGGILRNISVLVLILLVATPLYKYKEASQPYSTIKSYIGVIRDRIDIVDCKSKENFAERVDETIQVPMSSEYYQKYIQLTKGLPVLDDLFSDPAAFYNGYRRAVNRAGSDYLSEKVQAAAPILKRGKSIIYSNWLDFGIHPIVLALKENDISFRSFFGEVDVLDRERIIKAFNKGKFDVLIISRAGGEGIDLHGVRSVVILTPLGTMQACSKLSDELLGTTLTHIYHRPNAM